MENPSNPNVPVKVPHGKIKGKIKPKHMMVAALIARAVPIKDVAQQVNLSESQIYHLLSDQDSFVTAEILRIISELFAHSDRQLINLYSKALQKLDNMLSSSDEEKQFRAIDRIIKIYLTRSAKNAGPTPENFGIEPRKESIDEIILRKRKERGLPLPGEEPEEPGEDTSSPNPLPGEEPKEPGKDAIAQFLKDL